MATVLVAQNLQVAERSSGFQQLWRRLKNDELSDWRALLQIITRRELDPEFSDATESDWNDFVRLTGLVKSLVVALNAQLTRSDWRDAKAIDAALAALPIPRPFTFSEMADRAIAERLCGMVRVYAALGHSGDFGPSRLFNVAVNLPNPPLSTDAFDIFISYKTVRHAEEAESVTARLVELGYAVWFDQLVLPRKESVNEFFETEYLLSILLNAVHRSRCVLIFEAVAHAIVLPPGRSEAQALSDRTAMRGSNGELVAWDWQLAEIAAAERGLAVYANSIEVFGAPRAKPQLSFPFTDEADKFDSLRAALSYLDVKPAARPSV